MWWCQAGPMSPSDPGHTPDVTGRASRGSGRTGRVRQATTPTGRTATRSGSSFPRREPRPSTSVVGKAGSHATSARSPVTSHAGAVVTGEDRQDPGSSPRALARSASRRIPKRSAMPTTSVSRRAAGSSSRGHSPLASVRSTSWRLPTEDHASLQAPAPVARRLQADCTRLSRAPVQHAEWRPIPDRSPMPCGAERSLKGARHEQ